MKATLSGHHQHVSPASYLLERGADVRVATYDARMAKAAEGTGLRLYPV
ncbi:MAG: hypothetical protein IID07_06880 [Gemmatimonadetes bacterium]|nr:hypothetical protein [Gemmatimonadota bacterium]